jgi:hypothetical protein
VLNLVPNLLTVTKVKNQQAFSKREVTIQECPKLFELHSGVLNVQVTIGPTVVGSESSLELSFTSTFIPEAVKCRVIPQVPSAIYSLYTLYIPIPEPSSIEMVVHPTDKIWRALRDGKAFSVMYSMIGELKGSRQFEELQNELAKIFPDSHKLDYTEFETGIELLVVQKDIEVSFAAKGSGFKSVVAILTAIFWIRFKESDIPLLLLLDEPTAFLHDRAAVLFMKVLRDLPNVQLVVSAHSISLLLDADLTNVISFEGSQPQFLASQIDIAPCDLLRDQLTNVDLSF